MDQRPINKRQSNYDLLRIISTIAVIMIHTNWLYFGGMYDTFSRSFTWIGLALINILTRFAVPAFVMLSGAFILSNERNRDFKTFYKHSLKKIVIPTVLVIVFLIVVQIIINLVEHNGVVSGLIGILKGNFYSLWFIYMLVGLYYLTPLIVRLKEALTWNQYKTVAVVMTVWAVVSQATSYQKLAYSIGVCGAFLAYYFLGDVIKTEIESGSPRSKAKLVIIMLVCVAISFFWRATGHNYYIERAYINFFSHSIVVYSICVFMFFGTLTIKKDWSKLSGITFEVYLFHRLILRGLTPAIQNMTRHPFLEETLIVVLTFTISAILGLGFKRIVKWINNSTRINNMLDELKLWKFFS